MLLDMIQTQVQNKALTTLLNTVTAVRSGIKIGTFNRQTLKFRTGLTGHGRELRYDAIGRASLVFILRDVTRFAVLLPRLVQ